MEETLTIGGEVVTPVARLTARQFETVDSRDMTSWFFAFQSSGSCCFPGHLLSVCSLHLLELLQALATNSSFSFRSTIKTSQTGETGSPGYHAFVLVDYHTPDVMVELSMEVIALARYVIPVFLYLQASARPSYSSPLALNA